MNKNIDKLGEIGFALDYFQVCHFGVDEFPGNRIEIDFDGALGVLACEILGLVVR